jgi:RNA polymerase sigma factor (TIGR02999 family)
MVAKGDGGIRTGMSPSGDPKERKMSIEPDRAGATRILGALGRGEKQAARDLLPLVYDELRRLATCRLSQESPGQTHQPTALVHEAYLRLVIPGDRPNWEGRGHFFAAAAEAMRRILIDRARDRKRIKRGGDRYRKAMDLESILSDESKGTMWEP